MKRAMSLVSMTVLAGCASLFVFSAAMAQQGQPGPSKQDADSSTQPASAAKIIKGSSERGVSAALKDAVDRIPAPKGDQVFRFKVVNITGEVSKARSTCTVEIEVTEGK